jgi:hypothetical protein
MGHAINIPIDFSAFDTAYSFWLTCDLQHYHPTVSSRSFLLIG